MEWVNVHDGEDVDAEVVDGLQKMLDETDKLVHEFITQSDRFEQDQVTKLEVTLKYHILIVFENHVVSVDDLTRIIVGDLKDHCGSMDIVIPSFEEDLERISDIHPKLMALKYPQLFPHGDDGFHVQLQYGNGAKKK